MNPGLIVAAKNSRIISDGLIGYWPLTEGVGTIARDFSGNGRDGALVGTWQPGSRSTVLFTSGSTNGITVPDSDVFTIGTSGMSWAGWFTHASLPVAAQANRLWLFEKSNEWNISINSYNSNFGKYVCAIWNTAGSNENNRAWTTSAAIGVEVFLVATFTDVGASSFPNLYLNGTLNNGGTAQGGFNRTNSANAVYLGAAPFEIAFHGKIRGLRIYNRVLSQYEITTLYNAG